MPPVQMAEGPPVQMAEGPAMPEAPEMDYDMEGPSMSQSPPMPPRRRMESPPSSMTDEADLEGFGQMEGSEASSDMDYGMDEQGHGSMTDEADLEGFGQMAGMDDAPEMGGQGRSSTTNEADLLEGFGNDMSTEGPARDSGMEYGMGEQGPSMEDRAMGYGWGF